MTSPFAIAEVAKKQLAETQSTLERLRNFRKPYDSLYDKLYSQLTSYSKARFFPDKKTPRSNVFVPYPLSNMKQVRATIMQALFAVDPPFETLPRGAADSQAALNMQHALEYFVLKQGRLRSVMNDWVAGLAVYGWYALYVGWDWDYDTVPAIEQVIETGPDGLPVLNPVTLSPNIIPQRVFKKVPRNRPLYQVLDIYDVAVDPDGAYVARYFDKTFPQMLREQEMAAAAGQQLYDETALGSIESYLRQKPESERRSALIHIAELYDTINGTCTLVTAPSDKEALSYKDNRFANRSAQYAAWRRTMCDHEPVLLAPTYPNPFLHCRCPILFTNYTKLPGEPFGFGVIEPSANVTEHLNNSIRAIQDNWNLGVNRRYAVDLDRNMDLDGLVNANVPGGVVGVYGNINDTLKELPTHTPAAGDYQILPLFQQMIETASGVSDFYSRGVGSPVGNETATGIQSVIAQASKELVGIVQQIEEDIISPLLQMTASNIQQFITDEIEVRITDEMPAIPKVNSAFVTLAPEDLAGSFDFRLSGSLYMDNRTVQQANMLNLGQMLVTNPQLAAYIKWYPFLQEMQRVMRIPYPGRFIKTEQEVAMEQMQMLQAQLGLQKLMQQEGLAPDERLVAQPQGGGKKDVNRRYAKPESNPGTSATRSQGQRGGANVTGIGGMGVV